MTVYSGILSGSGWSLEVIGPIVPRCFFRVWVRVWVKENPESPAAGTDSGSPNGGVKCTKPVFLQTRYPSENGSGAFSAQILSDFFGLSVLTVGEGECTGN